MEIQALLVKSDHPKLRAIVRRRPDEDSSKASNLGFEGLWRSPSGSLYAFEKDGFICVSVHSANFVGWLNKVAIKDVRQVGHRWVGIQAFRNAKTGSTSQWIAISLELYRDKVVKHFPTDIPGDILVHGHTEIYSRVMDA